MLKTIKIVLGVLIGLAAWIVVATVGNLVIRALVSGYAEAEPTMRFMLPMLLARLGLGAVSSAAAGFVCAAALRSVPTTVIFQDVIAFFSTPSSTTLALRKGEGFEMR